MNENKLTIEELALEGFHCADCAVTIEKTIAKVNGVEQVKANFTSGKVKVGYDSSRVGHGDLVKTVEKIGYRVNSKAHKNIEKKSIWADPEFQITIVAGLLLGAGLVFKFLISDATLFSGLNRTFSISTLLFLTSIFFGAYYFSREGWAAIKHLRFNMNFLMSVAIIGAIIIEEYLEAASLAFLFSLAELLESYAVERARNSMRELMRLTPDLARTKRNGEEISVSVDQLNIDDLVAIRPGERVTVDGMISAGASSVDQSPITGESVPVRKEVGEQVFAGSINIEGYLEVRVTETSENTMVARIIHLVQDAEAQKAPTEKFVEKFAKIYTPVVVMLAIGVAIVPPLFFEASFNQWFIKALTLLVIACPCALVISTPVSVVSALTSASRNGVLIKGGIYLEEFSKVKVIAFDKTGTLTKGKLEVTDIIPLNGLVKDDLLEVAAALESRSEHPIAKAIIATANGVNLQEVQDFESIPGKGVIGRLNGKKYYIGQPDLFKGKIDLPAEELQALQQQGKTTMLVGTESDFIGIIGLSDQLRENAKEVVSTLHAAGKRVVMITGDNQETAKTIANNLGITHFHASLLPEDKLNEIKHLEQQHGKVAMVGDGINDSPALAAASVGIAMGAAGTDTALETADIALMSDDLSKLPYLVKLSEKSRSVIKENVLASILIKFSLAIGVFPGMVSLVIAVLVGDMGASLGVTSNAMRLAKIKAN